MQAVALNSDTIEWTPEHDKLHADVEGQATFAPQAAAFKNVIGFVERDPNEEPKPKVLLVINNNINTNNNNNNNSITNNTCYESKLLNLCFYCIALYAETRFSV